MAKAAELKQVPPAEAQRKASAWAPFGYKAFAVLWIATVVSNVGTWMHDVGAGWLMTELNPTPTMVAAVQAATTLPMFLFALLAGAIADIIDRRILLIGVNIFMGITAGLLAVLVATDAMTPLLLLIFTFAMGTGAAFMAPAWQAIVPQLVEREDLSSAIALNSMGINVSRAIGPALAGFLIVSAGLAWPFILNALSVIGIILALIWWKPPAAPATALPPEHVSGAFWSGLRYAWNSAAIRATLVRAAAFFVFASAYWAMLPLIARQVLQGGPSLYGILLASVGGGAVLGALILPTIREKLGTNGSVVLGTLGTAAVLCVFALLQNPIAAAAASALAGISWIAVLSSLHVSAQTALPNWVRARGLSIFLTIFFGSMAAGSMIWGQIATATSIPTALLIAAAGITLFVPITWAAKLGQGETMDLSPASHWPEPIIADDLEDPGGPVMIQIIYSVPTSNHTGFREAIGEYAKARRRSGAYGWSVMQDAEAPERFIETWFEPSWTDHLRHHGRVTEEDRKLEEAVRSHLTEGTSVEVRHYLTAADKPHTHLEKENLK